MEVTKKLTVNKNNKRVKIVIGDNVYLGGQVPKNVKGPIVVGADMLEEMKKQGAFTKLPPKEKSKKDKKEL